MCVVVVGRWARQIGPLQYEIVNIKFNVSFSDDRVFMQYQNWQYRTPLPGTDTLQLQNITSINMPFQVRRPLTRHNARTAFVDTCAPSCQHF